MQMRQNFRLKKNIKLWGILIGSLKTCADVPVARQVGASAKCPKVSPLTVHTLWKLPASPWPLWQMPHIALRMKRKISLEIQGLNSLLRLNNSPCPNQAWSFSKPHRSLWISGQRCRQSLWSWMCEEAAWFLLQKSWQNMNQNAFPNFQVHFPPIALFWKYEKKETFFTNSFG